MMNSYRPITKENFQKAVQIYNACTDRGEQLYLRLTEAEFYALFLVPPKAEDQIFSFYAPEDEGFILGLFDSGVQKFFVTMIQVIPSQRRKGIGKALLEKLEQAMLCFAREQQIPMQEIEVSYFNPVNITWILPNTTAHRHPNAPGVQLGSGAHLFFKNMGFRDFSYQNSYHLELDQYEWPEENLKPYQQKMEQAGYLVEFYDEKRHHGMQELVEDLNNDLWNWQIPAEMNREGGHRPMLIVSDHGKVGGFAGPIVPDAYGRGYFLGLAIHSQCRGCGAASILFNRLCLEFKKAGAQYMTLFTAEDNPARSTYEKAGFKIHASWADMKKRVRN